MLLNNWLNEEKYYLKDNVMYEMQRQSSLNSVWLREILLQSGIFLLVMNYLVEEYGHEEEIQQHGLGKRFIVNFEKEHSKDNCDILICGAAKRGPEQLQTSNGDH